MKLAAQSYNEVGSLSDLKHQITVKTEAGKSAKQSVVKLEHRMKDLAEIIKYAEQYKTNRSYHIAYKKSKIDDTPNTDNHWIKDINFDLITRAAVVYNTNKYFVGASLVMHTYDYRKRNFSLTNTFGTVRVYAGFNFWKRKEFRDK